MDSNQNNPEQPFQDSSPNPQLSTGSTYPNPTTLQAPNNNLADPAQNKSSRNLVSKMIIGLGVVILIAVVIVLADSRIRSKLFPSKNTPSATSVSNISNVCSVLNNTFFQAVKKDSLTNTNILKFNNGTAEWDYGNIVASGPYSCTNNQIQLHLQNSHNNGGDYTAYFYPSTQILNFHALEYSLSH